MQMPVVAEQHDADFVFVDVECDAEHIAGKLHQFLETHAGKTGDLGDAGGDAGDRADFPRRQLRREGFPRLAYPGKRAVENVLRGSQASLFMDALFRLWLAGFWLASFSSSPTPFSSDAR